MLTMPSRSPSAGACVALAALACAVALPLAGCGSDGASTTSSGAGSGSGKAPEQVTVAFNQRVTTLDPDLAVAQADVNVINLIGGRLYDAGASGTPQPSLARSGRASADGLSWTFKLRSGLKFSDGTPLRASDVEATFERALKDKSNVQAALYAPIRSVTSDGATTVTFHLKRPYPDLPEMLAEEFAMVLPASRLGKASSFRAPISAGPYVLTSWSGDDVQLRRNPNFNGPQPAVDRLRLTTIEDSNTRVSALRTGQIDLAFDLPPSLLPTLKGDKSITAAVTPGYGWYSLNMSDRAAPLDDVRVRRAISLAIDRDRITQTIWQGQNKALSTFWPPPMRGYSAADNHTTPDVAQAKQLLAGTACASGCTLKLEYPPAVVPFGDQLALLIASDLKKIGVSLKLQKTEFNTFNTDLGAGRYQLALYGLYDFVNIPDGLVTYALSTDGGINANFSGFQSPPIQALITRALTTSGSKQTQLLQQIDTSFAQDQPFVTLANWAYVPASRLPKSVIEVQPSGLLRVGSGG